MRPRSIFFALAIVGSGVLACARIREARFALRKEDASANVFPAAQTIDKGTSATWGGSVTFVQASDGEPSRIAWSFGDGSPESILCSDTGGEAAPSCRASVCTFTETRSPGTLSPSGSILALADLNGDGGPDLVTGAGVRLGDGAGGFRAELPAPVALPHGLAVGDVDGDGSLDLVVPGLGDEVGVLLGRGDGTFDPPLLTLVGSGTVGAAVADFDRDGIEDLAVSNPSTHALSILLGRGDGSFVRAGDVPMRVGPTDLVTADFDGDGNADIAATDPPAQGFSYVLGRGDGTFGARVDGYFARSPSALLVGDFNEDGKPDLAFDLGDQLAVSLNNGSGAFPTYSPFFLPFQTSSQGFAAGDVDGDGHLDLAATAAQTGTLVVSAGRGDGSFEPYLEYATVPSSPTHVLLGDLDRDGALDAVVDGSPGIATMLGNGAGGFGGVTLLPSNGSPSAAAIGDVDGDGIPDLVASNSSTNTISVWKGTGQARFGGRTDGATGTKPTAVALADVNGDGRADAGVANTNSNTVSVLLGQSNGTFGPKTDYAVGPGPKAVAFADLNRDGRPDLVVGNTGSNTVSLFLGTNGGFGAKADYTTGGGPASIAFADFDEDGNPDVAVANRSNGSVSVLPGRGDGTLGPKLDTAVTYAPVAIAAGDFDRDGHADLATADTQSIVSILLGRGDGTFAAPQQLPAGANPVGIVATDFDRDGALDLATAGQSPATLMTFHGHGDGTFAAPVTTIPAVATFPTTAVPTALASGDLDGDAGPDLVIAIDGADELVVMPIRPTWTCPVGTSHVYSDSKGTGAGPTFTWTPGFVARSQRGEKQASFAVTVKDVPPIVSASTDPVPEGSDAVVTSAWTHPCTNDAYRFHVAWGDGSSTDVPTATDVKSAASAHLYPDGGSYSMTVTVVDDEGTSSAPVVVPVTVANAPLVLESIQSNSPVLVGQPITIWIHLQNGAGDVVRYDYAWDGDATYTGVDDVVDSPSSQSTFASTAPRFVTVNVRASDDDGSEVDGQIDVQWVGTNGGGSGGNQPPVALPRSYSTAENVALSLPLADLLSGDYDPDGDSIAFSSTTQPQHGTVSVSSGQLVYTPAPYFHGSDGFYYTIADSFGAVATAAVDVTITSVNQVPIAGDDQLVTTVDVPVTSSVAALLANDQDPDGDALSIAGVGTPTNGTVTLSGQSVTFVPATGFTGIGGFDYLLQAGADTTVGHVSVTVLAVNRAPIANPDVLATAQGQPLTVAVATLLANDSDPDSDPVAFSFASAAAHGSVAVVGTSLTYTPVAPFHGTDTFYYSITDDHGAQATAPVSVNVSAVNHAPVAAGDLATTLENKTVSIAIATLLANDGDPDGDALTVVSVGSALNGTAVLSGSNVLFSPANGYGGSASFVYVVSDGVATSQATVEVDVLPVDLGPGLPTTVAPPFGSEVQVLTPTLSVSGGADPDADALSYEFQICSSPLFEGNDLQDSGWIVSGGATTSWTSGPLQDFTTWYWRARASDGLVDGDWAVSRFDTDSTNVAPSAPATLTPGGDALLADVFPTLTIVDAADVNGDPLTYDFEIHEDGIDGPLVATSSGVPEGTGGRTSWTVSGPLRRGRTFAWWARAVDSHGAAGPWSAPTTFEIYAAPSKGGCGCDLGGSGSDPNALLGGIVAGLLFLWRRRRRPI